jgi:hypothetical protein
MNDLRFAEELRAQLVQAAKRQPRRHGKKRFRPRAMLLFGAGLGVGLVVAMSLSLSSAPTVAERRAASPQDSDAVARTNRGPGPDINIQKDGPLFDGKQVTLEEARKLVAYTVPDPVENDVTGALTGIWIDTTGQTAFVWDTDLRLYLHEADKTQAEVATDYETKVKNDKSEAEPWVLTEVKGRAALGVEGKDVVASSLSFQDGGVMFEFVGPAQTLTQLIQLAQDQSTA